MNCATIDYELGGRLNTARFNGDTEEFLKFW
jgi:hypothetical protein